MNRGMRDALRESGGSRILSAHSGTEFETGAAHAANNPGRNQPLPGVEVEDSREEVPAPLRNAQHSGLRGFLRPAADASPAQLPQQAGVAPAFSEEMQQLKELKADGVLNMSEFLRMVKELKESYSTTAPAAAPAAAPDAAPVAAPAAAPGATAATSPAAPSSYVEVHI